MCIRDRNITKYEEIFKQEGWHYELTGKDDELKINGVVYNEMKGASVSYTHLDVYKRQVYDELYKHPEIKHVLTSHEQGASHAADGYARSTGKAVSYTHLDVYKRQEIYRHLYL